MPSWKSKQPGRAPVRSANSLPLIHPVVRQLPVIYSGHQRLTLELEYPLTRPGITGWVVVPRLGAAAPAEAELLRSLHNAGLATLAVNVVGGYEGFDVPAWTARLTAALRWLQRQPIAHNLRLGLLAAGPAAAAALSVAADLGPAISAVVSLGGRPDLAAARLPAVQAATLLVVGRSDRLVLDANRAAEARLNDRSRLVLAPSWRYLRRRLTAPGALDQILAVEWLGQYVGGLLPEQLPRAPVTPLMPAVRHGRAAAAATVLALLAALARPAGKAGAISTMDRDTVTGTMTYSGSSVANNLTVTKNADGSYTLTDSPEGAIGLSASAIAAFCSGNGTTTINCPASAISALVINTNDGADRITLVLRDNYPATTINGGTSNDTLAINDTLTDYPDTYTISGNSLSRPGAINLSFSAVDRLEIDAENNDNIINVTGTTPATVINAGQGNDVFVIGNSNLLGDIDGALTVFGGSGSDTLRVRDSSSSSPMTYSGASISRSGVSLVVGDDTVGSNFFEAVDIQSGGGADNLNAAGFVRGPVTLQSNGAADTLRGSSGSFNDYLDGGSGSGDRLVATGDNDWDLDTALITGQGSDTLVGFEEAVLTVQTNGHTVQADQFFAGPVTINGGPGADFLRGSPQADNIQGNNGDDTLIGELGNDTLNGGGDNDLLRETQNTNSVTVTGSNMTSSLGNDVLAGIDRVSLAASSGNDVMDASGFFNGPVTLNAGSGNNTLMGGGGNYDDSLSGSFVNDWVVGTGNVDWTLSSINAITATLFGTNRGNDYLLGINHASLTGGAGNNIINAVNFTQGSVVLIGLGGTDFLNGGSGNDTLSGGTENDTIFGFSGTDRLVESGDGNFKLTNSALTGIMGTDILNGIDEADLTASDTLGDNLDASEFSNGPVTLRGQGGNDTLSGGTGADCLLGGNGTDSLVASRSDAGGSIAIILTDNNLAQTAQGTDVLSSIERASLTGGSGNDSLLAFGFTGNVTLIGNLGDDLLAGGSGNDSLDGKGDQDTLAAGGNGNIFLGLSAVTGTVGVGSDSFTNIEFASLTGGSGDNVIDASGFTGGATLRGLAGRDTLTGGEGDDLLDGGSDAVVDTALMKSNAAVIVLNGNNFSGQGNDTLTDIDAYGVIGGSNDQIISASTFNHPVLLNGAGGADYLIGSPFADTLIGGAGNDTITGGASPDEIYGDEIDGSGNGVDHLVESTNNNMVLTATSFTVGGDTDTLSNIESASLTGGNAANDINAAAFTGAVTLIGGQGDDTLSAPSASSSLNGGIGDDLAVLSRDSSFTISNSGAVGAATYDFTAIDRVSLTAGAGANNLDASNFAGPVTLRGLGGNDTLRGSAFSDVLDGGSGLLDRVVATGDSNYQLSNFLLVSGFPDVISGFEQASLTGGAGNNSFDSSTFTGTVTLDGQGGADSLVGTSQNDLLKGGIGDDTITGGLGADTMDGEAGEDVLAETGDVNFILTATSLSGLGGDQIANFEFAVLAGTSANVGNSFDASAVSFPVFLVGGGGDDTLAGGTNNDVIDGGFGTDTATYDVGNANVTLTGSNIQGLGNDVLVSIEAFIIQGGNGPNIFDASAFDGAVTMRGGGGNDLLIGSPNADVLQGQNNDDTIIGNSGNDTIDGGSGTDLIMASGDFPVFNLTDTGLVGDGTDSLLGVEGALLVGGAGPNIFNTTGFSKTVYLDGGGGANQYNLSTAGGIITGVLGSHDVISLTADLNLTLSDASLLAGGNYQLSGIEAARLTGGAAANKLDAGNFTGDVTLLGLGNGDTLIGGSGDDCLLGGDGNDTLTGNRGADNLQGEAHTGAGDRWIELADFDITLIAEGLVGEVIDTVTGIESAQLTGTDVNNRFNLTGFTGVATLDGGLGNDSLTGGSGGDVLLGKAGADTLVGTGGNDTLDGGSETDLLFASNALTFTLATTRLDGVGRDTLISIEEAHLVGNALDNTYDASAFGSALTAVGQVTLEGGLGNDTLIGGVKDDSLSGGQGNDSLVGNDGADTLTGGDTAPGANTNDTLVGGAGADLLDGVFGDDVLFGGADNDILIGASGNDFMDGGAGDDVLSAAFDDDTAVGTPGNDTLTGGPGNDTLEGGPGFDRVTEAADVNFTYELGTLHGGALGDDLLTSIEEASLTGGGSANVFDLSSFPGPVTLRGGGGNDIFTGSAFSDLLDGGANTDRVKETADVNWTLTDALVQGNGSDVLIGIEEASLTGGSSANAMNAAAFTGSTTLIGGLGNDTLVGGFGPDFLDGGDDNDTLTGNLGDDSLVGGLGDNAVTELVTATTGVTLTLTNNSLLGLGTDVLSNTLRVTLTGGSGNDLFLATAFTGTATLQGAGGADTFHGGLGNDSLDGGPGTDRVEETYDQHFRLTDSSLTFSTTVILSTDVLNGIEEASLTGGDGPNTIDAAGFSGPTSLTGLGGGDRLIGGTNADSLLGGAGFDTLTGGLGNDTLDGGDDTDRVIEVADVALLKLQNNFLTGLGLDELRSIELANLSGGPGNNTLDASLFTGAVTLNGDAGSDLLIGGSAGDELNGGDGADTLTGNGGSDIMFGGSGAFEDSLLETSNATTILLTSANLVAGTTDFLNGLEVATITGGAANQTMDASAFSGRVRFDGAGGNDSLIGTINADTLLGGLGSDTLRGGLGNDQLDGGGGGGDVDRLVEASDANLVLTNAGLVITQGVSLLSSDVITGFEQASLTGGLGANIISSAQFTGSVTLTGLSGDDYLEGGPLKDSLLGGPGSDTLTGGLGDDTLLGGAGDTDRLVETGDVDFTLTPTQLTGLGTDSLDNFEAASLTGGTSANTLNTLAFPGSVTLDGAAGNDTLTSAGGDDRLVGGPDDDWLTAGAGADTILGDAGFDTLKEAGDVNFVLTETGLSGLGGDSLGGLEAASLTGGVGDNSFDLFGWAHAATIDAGAGADALSLSGTSGADNFLLTANSLTFGAITDLFNDLETLTLAGGDGADTFDLTNLLALADGNVTQATATLSVINLLGGNGDDLFELVPYPTIAINVDGGAQDTADTINFHAGGLYVPPEDGRLAAEGQQPIAYNDIEQVNIFQQLLRLFIPIITK